MFIYQPEGERRYRVAWYGGESSMLHFERVNAAGQWREIDCMTFMHGLPTGTKELYQEMQEYYNYGITMDYDNSLATII